MISVTATATSAASPATVWSILSDHDKMADWTALPSAKRTVDGEGDPNGVGAVREIGVGVGPALIIEEVTEFEPESKLSYTMHRGLPVRSYNGTTTLEADGDGTKITWTIEAAGKPGVLEPVLKPVLQFLVGRLSGDLAKRAARG